MRYVLLFLFCFSVEAFERLPFRCIELNVSIDREAIKRSGLSLPQVTAATRKAIREWNKASGLNMKLVQSGNILIVPFSHHRFFGLFNPLELSGGVVTRAEVRLNCLKLKNNKPLINATVLHELGHALGLAHTDEPTATMYPLITEDTNTLSMDDVIGVRNP